MPSEANFSTLYPDFCVCSHFSNFQLGFGPQQTHHRISRYKTIQKPSKNQLTNSPRSGHDMAECKFGRTTILKDVHQQVLLWISLAIGQCGDHALASDERWWVDSAVVCRGARGFGKPLKPRLWFQLIQLIQLTEPNESSIINPFASHCFIQLKDPSKKRLPWPWAKWRFTNFNRPCLDFLPHRAFWMPFFVTQNEKKHQQRHLT